MLTGRDDFWGAMTMVLVLFNMRGTISLLLAFSSLLVRFLKCLILFYNKGCITWDLKKI